MAILSFATSMADWFPGTVQRVNSDTNSGRLGPYVNEGIQMQDLFNAPTGAELNFAATADVWVSFYAYNNDDDSFDQPIYFDDANGDPVLRAQGSNGFGGNFQFQWYNGSSWVNVGPLGLGQFSLKRYDIRVLTDASGIIEVYENGTLLGDSGTIDTTVSGARSGVDTVRLNGWDNSGLTLSAFIVADESTIGMEYVQMRPSAAGTYSQWTGDVTDIDEIGFDDADSISSNTADSRVSFDTGAITTDFDTGYVVVGFGVSARAWAGSAISNDFNFMVRSGTTDGDGATKTISTTKQPYREIFSTNPATSSAWTISEIKSAEIGAKLAGS